MLKIENLSFVAGDKKILDNINLEFNTGINVITGHNGSGKTTFAKILMGIEKPTSGKIVLNGEDITNLSLDQRAKKGISLSFQQPATFKGIKVLDLLRLANNKLLSVKDACEYLSKVGLCARDYINREVSKNLSGGEQKRIEIATILAKGGDVMIFDEPEAGIDMWAFDSLIKLFENLKDKIVIIISHQKRILEISDKIFLFNKSSVSVVSKDELKTSLNQNKCNVLRSENADWFR